MNTIKKLRVVLMADQKANQWGEFVLNGKTYLARFIKVKGKNIVDLLASTVKDIKHFKNIGKMVLAKCPAQEMELHIDTIALKTPSGNYYCSWKGQHFVLLSTGSIGKRVHLKEITDFQEKTTGTACSRLVNLTDLLSVEAVIKPANNPQNITKKKYQPGVKGNYKSTNRNQFTHRTKKAVA